MTAITGRTRVAAVIGSPVRHSLSPVIHNAAFAACGLDVVYVAFEVAPGSGAAAVDAMRLFDWLGVSVTMPHKREVIAACDELTDTAVALGAVNCLRWEAGRIVGDNTDGEGFVRGLRAELGVDVAGSVCVVVGAGGAAKAVVRALADGGADRVVVINRNRERAQVAAALAGRAGAVGEPSDLGAADVVVNATPLGMASTETAGRLPFDVARLGEHAVVADLIYHPAETPLLAAARERGLRRQNGLAMLVFQAATQFEHWTAAEAPTDVMMAAAKAAIGSEP
jgi:shikimate dehydrogenase